MKKRKRLFKLFDFVLLFWAFFLILGSILVKDTPTYITILFVLSGLSLLGYFGYVIKLRRDLDSELTKEKELNEKIEEESYEIEDNGFNNNRFTNMKKQYLEDEIERELKKLYPNARILRNVYLPKVNGTRTEIDLIMFHTSGIYIFEAKNLSATLQGNWSNVKINAIYQNGKIYEIQNPIIQNSQHFECLKSALGINETGIIKNIVVLGYQTFHDFQEYKQTKPNYANVFSIRNFEREIKNISKRSKCFKSQVWVENIFNNICFNTKITDEEKEIHNQEIKNKYSL